MHNLELELKELIVEALRLEDVRPEQISSDETLFGTGGLGLDSIDLLELGVALREKYGMPVLIVREDTKNSFRNIASLAQFVSDWQQEARRRAPE